MANDAERHAESLDEWLQARNACGEVYATISHDAIQRAACDEFMLKVQLAKSAEWLAAEVPAEWNGLKTEVTVSTDDDEEGGTTTTVEAAGVDDMDGEPVAVDWEDEEEEEATK